MIIFGVCVLSLVCSGETWALQVKASLLGTRQSQSIDMLG